MIEPTWNWMKKRTTRKGAISICKLAEKAWVRCWRELSQSLIQQWIRRIPRHIKEVIRLKGDNCYHEGEFDPEFQVPDYIVHPTGSWRAVWNPDTLADTLAGLNIDSEDLDEVDDDDDDEYEDIE
jgi:hypothetical protein